MPLYVSCTFLRFLFCAARINGEKVLFLQLKIFASKKYKTFKKPFPAAVLQGACG